MKIERAASIPLIVHDPYFSIWSSHDHLYDGNTVHWSRKQQRMSGYITIDGITYCFMGDKKFHGVINQQSVEVTATSTKYIFENEKVTFSLSFTTPLLLDDPVLVSRPCTYIDYQVERKETETDVKINFIVSDDLVACSPGDIIGDNYERDEYHYAFMGKAKQEPLGHSGDNITIDWGFLYIASNEECTSLEYSPENRELFATTDMGVSKEQAAIVIAYDDLLAINYFGQWRKAYWTKEYATIIQAIGASFKDKVEVQKKCQELDAQIEEQATELVGSDYAFLCNMSYRQVIGAHKLIEDEEGNIIFLSKENDSNGCTGTVDVTYPSAPLFMLFDTEYVKGMLRPVFKFAQCDAWEFNFAPHDVGRYPYATGQVYGLNNKKENIGFKPESGTTFPFYYMYPKGAEIYNIRSQMPVEECGNMLTLTAAVSKIDGNAEFAKPYYTILEQWAKYLVEYGLNPGDQLCTDDFAGHLAGNVNLSAKAIMGIEAFAYISGLMGEEKQQALYHEKAVEMAKFWMEKADAKDHTMLTFGDETSWSLKYNLVWDKFFASELFPESIFEREIAYYISKNNEYGVPLDNRATYTKSDWILWCAAMSEKKEEQEQLIKPVAKYLRDTTKRLPFSDWYDTESGRCVQFIARSVQGGVFMPLLIKRERS